MRAGSTKECRAPTEGKNGVGCQKLGILWIVVVRLIIRLSHDLNRRTKFPFRGTVYLYINGKNKMKITKTSPFTGKVATLDLPITQERIDAWQNDNTMVQEAFPELNADQREFLMTGITAEEWDHFIKEDE